MYLQTHRGESHRRTRSGALELSSHTEISCPRTGRSTVRPQGEQLSARREVPLSVDTLRPVVVVVDQPGQVGDAVAVSGPQRHLQRVEDQCGAHGPGDPPAEDPAGVHVDDEPTPSLEP